MAKTSMREEESLIHSFMISHKTNEFLFLLILRDGPSVAFCSIVSSSSSSSSPVLLLLLLLLLLAVSCCFGFGRQRIVYPSRCCSTASVLRAWALRAKKYAPSSSAGAGAGAGAGASDGLSVCWELELTVVVLLVCWWLWWEENVLLFGVGTKG